MPSVPRRRRSRETSANTGRPPAMPNSAMSSTDSTGPCTAPSGTSECGRYLSTITPATNASNAPTNAARCSPLTNAPLRAGGQHGRRVRRQRAGDPQRAGDRRVGRASAGRPSGRAGTARSERRSARPRRCRAPRCRARRRARGSRRSSPSRRRRGGRGTADMIDAVIGDIVSAMPAGERDEAHDHVRVRACATPSCASRTNADRDASMPNADRAVRAEPRAEPRRERRDDDHDRARSAGGAARPRAGCSRARAGSTA